MDDQHVKIVWYITITGGASSRVYETLKFSIWWFPIHFVWNWHRDFNSIQQTNLNMNDLLISIPTCTTFSSHAVPKQVSIIYVKSKAVENHILPWSLTSSWAVPDADAPRFSSGTIPKKLNEHWKKKITFKNDNNRNLQLTDIVRVCFGHQSFQDVPVDTLDVSSNRCHF